MSDFSDSEKALYHLCDYHSALAYLLGCSRSSWHNVLKMCIIDWRKRTEGDRLNTGSSGKQPLKHVVTMVQ